MTLIPPVFPIFKRKTAALIVISKPSFDVQNATPPTSNGFVFIAICQQSYSIKQLSKRKEPITANYKSACYRLCVFASGSLITDIFNCFTLISVSCLHFGQNSGKFSSTVSLRILIRVLLLQIGHNIKSVCFIVLISKLQLLFVKYRYTYGKAYQTCNHCN